MFKPSTTFSILSSIFILAACASVDSSDIHTSGICANIDITNQSGRVKIDTTLTAGCGLFASNIVLGNSEHISAHYLSQNYILQKHTSWFFNDTNYDVVTGSNYIPGEQVTVSLNRSDEYMDAPNNRVNLPSTFNLLQPVNNSSYITGNTINFNWDRNHPSNRIILNLNCTYNSGSNSNGTISRTRSGTAYQISVSEVSNFMYSSKNGSPVSCSGTASVSQGQAGYTDPALKAGSSIHARYIESRTINIIF